MPRRNFSMQTYWAQVATANPPKLHFASAGLGWEEWRQQAATKYFELLGDFPERVALEAEIESSVEEGEIIRERVVFNSERFMSVPCQVLRPKTMAANGKNAALVCSHGHGRYGKDPVAGIRSSPGMIADIETHNYDYGLQMAKAGYLTICPDLRGFGERRDGVDPFPGRDPCNVNYLRGTMVGRWPLTLNIWDIKCCVDYLETRSEVDPKRIGMMGLSQGGTMTTFATAAEPRIAAADIMGYINPWEAFAFDRANFCGSQIIPNIYAWFDTDDLAGLIAPRPLLLDMGIYDDCFYIHDLLKGYEGVKRIYEAAGVADRLWTDIHPHGHGFGGVKRATEFFGTYL
jgi:Dienelactone hydrolase family